MIWILDSKCDIAVDTTSNLEKSEESISCQPSNPSVIVSLSQQKVELRRTLLQLRRSLPMADWQARSHAICQHLQRDRQFQQAQTILAYFSIRHEADLNPLFTMPKTWGFPRCVGASLTWHQWAPGQSLQTGDFGIQEPTPDSPLIDPAGVDLLLIPAVACDRHGYRLGYGGGFYDRMMDDPIWHGKRAIGIVFEFAYLPRLPVEPWDQPLTGVCTEVELRNCPVHS